MYFYCSQTLGKASQKQLCNKIRIQSLENRCCLALFVGQAAFVKWYLDGRQMRGIWSIHLDTPPETIKVNVLILN